MAAKTGAAVQIVDCESGKPRFKLDVLLPILEKVGKIPLAIVSINGPERTEKPNLLDYFLRYYSSEGDENWIDKTLTDGFERKSSSESQTGGILVWSEPFFLNKNGRRIAVLLMDTQVDFDRHDDLGDNYEIFVLISRLSSVYICSVKHQTYKDELLSMHIDYWLARTLINKRLRYAPYTSLVMLIRDWGNPEDYAFGYHDKKKPRNKNFCKDKMTVKRDTDDDVKKVYEEVRARYETVACCLLPHPGNALESKDRSRSLDKAFRDAILEFVPRVGAAENLVLNKRHGYVVTGHEMGNWVQYWDGLIARTNFTDIKSIAEINQTALSKATDAYKNKMDTTKACDESDMQPFEKAHKMAREEAMTIFDKHKSTKHPYIDITFQYLLKAHIRMTSEFYCSCSVQIVTMDSEKVRVKLDALLPILEKVGDVPLAVVSVNGPVRAGKSYVLGHLLRFLGTQSDGKWIREKLIKEYDWNGTTAGIIIWSEPFFVLKDGRQIAILLMDTQGSFDDKTDYYINYMLFSLSCLLSSVFIYNVNHKTSGDVLQFLQLFLGFARKPLEDRISKPKLVVMVRDWQNSKRFAYGYHREGKPEEKHVLKDMLEDGNCTAEHDAQEVYNQMMASLQPVACCLLPHPGNRLATEDKTYRLEQSFLDTLQEVVPRICAAENVVVKTVDGRDATGFDMVDIVKGWDELITGVSFDDIKSLASVAVETQYQTALCTALETYTKQMDAMTDKYGFNRQMLETVHGTTRKEAVAIFHRQKTVRNSCIEKEFLVNLEKEIQTVHERNMEINNILTKFYNLKECSAQERTRIQQEVKSEVENVEKMLKERAKPKKQDMEEIEKNLKVECLKQEWDKIIKQLGERKIIREKIASEKKATKLKEELKTVKESMVVMMENMAQVQEEKEKMAEDVVIIAKLIVQEMAKQQQEMKAEMEKAKLERDKLAQDFKEYKEKRRWFK